MKYQLVALFDEDSNSKIRAYQRSICKRYKLYKNNPELYIPLSFIDDNNYDLIERIIQKTLTPYKQFKIKLNNSVIVTEKNKMVNIEVDSKGYVSRIARNINSSFEDYRVSCSTVSEESSDAIYLPIAPMNYTIKKACSTSPITVYRDCEYLSYIKVNRVELWKLSSSGKKEKTLVKTFDLKLF